MKRTVMIVLLGLLATAATTAYEPVIVVGATAYAGIGSDDPSAPVFVFGPQIDVDMRLPVGRTVYLAGWYTGNLWFDVALDVPTDESSLGLLVGGSAGPLENEAQARLTISSPLGDGSLAATPEWSVTSRLPLPADLTASFSYDGTLVLDEATDADSLSNAGRLGIAWDPSLAIGLTGTAGAAYDGYTERFVLDASGMPTSVPRTDLRYEAVLAAEGILGYFTLWDASLTSGLIDSNANRYLSATSTLEAQSEDQTFARLAASLQASPAEAIGIDASLAARSSWYATRSALAADGTPTEDAAYVFAADATVTLDWTIARSYYLVIGATGSYAYSNDATLGGWSGASTIALQLNL